MNAETKRALLIGISDYGNTHEEPEKWANISGANDISLLTPLFNEQGFSIISLVDSQATYTGITKMLKKLVKESKKGDTVYIHFSMHGQP
ncbi:MAG: caspase family protein, partial [Allobaculum sp.]|nr:caspase family protein [Allobaculum sp.]